MSPGCFNPPRPHLCLPCPSRCVRLGLEEQGMNSAVGTTGMCPALGCRVPSPSLGGKCCGVCAGASGQTEQTPVTNHPLSSGQSARVFKSSAIGFGFCLGLKYKSCGIYNWSWGSSMSEHLSGWGDLWLLRGLSQEGAGAAGKRGQRAAVAPESIPYAARGLFSLVFAPCGSCSSP